MFGPLFFNCCQSKRRLKFCCWLIYQWMGLKSSSSSSPGLAVAAAQSLDSFIKKGELLSGHSTEANSVKAFSYSEQTGGTRNCQKCFNFIRFDNIRSADCAMSSRAEMAILARWSAAAEDIKMRPSKENIIVMFLSSDKRELFPRKLFHLHFHDVTSFILAKFSDQFGSVSPLGFGAQMTQWLP